MPRILVINPNSNEQVTDNLRESLIEFDGDTSIECCTLADGPFGIETNADIAAVIPLISERIAQDNESDAFVIACYSDPGLAEYREQFDKPVFGMQESAVRKAAANGRRFGVLALSQSSISRHLPYIESLGLSANLVTELPLNISVEQSASDPATLARVVESGQRLVDEYGAEAIVLGCAGMAAIQQAAQKKLPVPVIEPAQAAVSFAIQSGG
jgi:Asp/Glu/hydantoin racemase